MHIELFNASPPKAEGEATVGYFPEHINKTEHEYSEICEVAGMIGLALKLSHAGLGDYWDDADRWIRNQFAEGQLRQVDWVYRMSARERVDPDRQGSNALIDEGVATLDRVPERNIGSFAGWPSAWAIM